jgi:hypothetical protein
MSDIYSSKKDYQSNELSWACVPHPTPTPALLLAEGYRSPSDNTKIYMQGAGRMVVRLKVGIRISTSNTSAV